VIAIELQQIAEEFYWGKSGLLFGLACWVLPSAGDREDSATETHRLMLMGKSQQARQGCKGAVRAHQQHREVLAR